MAAKRARTRAAARGEHPRESIHGTVFNGYTGEPLPRHIVRVFSVLSPADADYLGQGRTGPDGAFVIRFRDTPLARDARKAFPEAGPGLVLRVYDPHNEHVHATEERSGRDRFEPWHVAVQLPGPNRDARWLNAEFGKELERFLKQPKVLGRIARILAREGGMAQEEIYRLLKESDPFGINPFTFRTTVCCILNRLLDEFKQTALGSQVALGGNTYKHLGSVFRVLGVTQLQGFVLGPWRTGSWSLPGVEGRTEADEDFNFGILPTNVTYPGAVFAVANTGRIPSREIGELNNSMVDGSNEYFWRIHCEITPCDQRGGLRRFMGQIRAAAQQADDARRANQPWAPIRVALQGEITFDGTHLSFPAHLEVHDVKDAVVLPSPPPSVTPVLPQP